MSKCYGTRNTVTGSPEPSQDAVLGQLHPVHTVTQSFQSNVTLFSYLLSTGPTPSVSRSDMFLHFQPLLSALRSYLI